MKKTQLLLLSAVGIMSVVVYASCVRSTPKFVPAEKFPGACKGTNTWFDESMKQAAASNKPLPASLAGIKDSCDLFEFEFTYSYDKRGNLIKTTAVWDGETTVTEKKYNEKNILIYRKRTSSTNKVPWTEITRYILNRQDQVVRVETELKHRDKTEKSIARITHLSETERIIETEKFGNAIKMQVTVENDTNGNLLKESQRLVDANIVLEEKKYEYDDKGNLVSERRQHGDSVSVINYERDKYGNVLSKTKTANGKRCPVFTAYDYACWKN